MTEALRRCVSEVRRYPGEFGRMSLYYLAAARGEHAPRQPRYF